MNDGRIAAIFTTWAIGGVLVTPLCGLWFSCGCDWPWGNFYTMCNAILRETPPPHCPWCTHPIAAGMSIGTGIVSASWIVWKLRRGWSQACANVVFRSVIGTMTFTAVLLMGGWLTSLLTAYPGFLGTTWH